VGPIRALLDEAFLSITRGWQAAHRQSFWPNVVECTMHRSMELKTLS
jgi:hypothetical protein